MTSRLQNSFVKIDNICFAASPLFQSVKASTVSIIINLHWLYWHCKGAADAAPQAQASAVMVQGQLLVRLQLVYNMSADKKACTSTATSRSMLQHHPWKCSAYMLMSAVHAMSSADHISSWSKLTSAVHEREQGDITKQHLARLSKAVIAFI